MATSPTQNTLKYLRECGWDCQVVEHWNQWSRTRKDLFDVIDIVALTGGEILGVQCTTMSNKSARMNKMKASILAKAWVKSGGILWLMCWRKLKGRWTSDIYRFAETDFI